MRLPLLVLILKTLPVCCVPLHSTSQKKHCSGRKGFTRTGETPGIAKTRSMNWSAKWTRVWCHLDSSSVAFCFYFCFCFLSVFLLPFQWEEKNICSGISKGSWLIDQTPLNCSLRSNLRWPTVPCFSILVSAVKLVTIEYGFRRGLFFFWVWWFGFQANLRAPRLFHFSVYSKAFIHIGTRGFPRIFFLAAWSQLARGFQVSNGRSLGLQLIIVASKEDSNCYVWIFHLWRKWKWINMR